MTGEILITGASGFIGAHLCKDLTQRGLAFRRVLRQSSAASEDIIAVGDIYGKTDWARALDGIDTVIHLAGRAHILKDISADPLTEFRRVNADGTVNLAEQMITQGCRRLVFVSTIGVNGDSTPVDQPFTEASPPNPQLPYAVAKWEAEQRLSDFRDNLEIVVVRPSLVYGAGAPGNFQRLLRAIQRGFPLPLGSARNLRSLIAVQNLCDFLVRCVEHPSAAGETFLISDGEDLSTPDLLRRIGHAINHPTRLLPVPESMLRLPLRLMRRERMLNQLFGSLRVDSTKARQRLDWHPPLTVNEALQRLSEAVG